MNANHQAKPASRPRVGKANLPSGGRESSEGIRPLSSRSQWQIAWHKLRRDRLAMAGLTGLLLLVVVTVLSPWLVPYPPTYMDADYLLSPPNRVHRLGTDDLGRDILSRVLSGGRESLRVALLAVAIAIGGGTLVGLISGYYGGFIDTLIQRLVEVFMAFPNILLLLTIVAALGPSLTTVLVAAGFSSIPRYARLVRGSVLSARNMEYVVSAKVVGATEFRIMLRHILPNIMAPIIIFSTLRLGGVIMATAGLSYIGLGAQPPSPEWGAMLNYGRAFLRSAPWMSLFPGLGIFWATLCINLLGDGLRDALDPRLRQR